MPECTADVLAELAACLTGLTPKQQQAIQTFLLCQIANGGGAAAPLIYRATLTQVGSGNPVANILENTLGTVTFTRDDVGSYLIGSAGLFTSGQTITFWSQSVSSGIGVTFFNSSLIGLINNSDDWTGSIQILVYP